jgi:hypothetical protein
MLNVIMLSVVMLSVVHSNGANQSYSQIVDLSRIAWDRQMR